MLEFNAAAHTKDDGVADDDPLELEHESMCSEIDAIRPDPGFGDQTLAKLDVVASVTNSRISSPNVPRRCNAVEAPLFVQRYACGALAGDGWPPRD